MRQVAADGHLHTAESMELFVDRQEIKQALAWVLAGAVSAVHDGRSNARAFDQLFVVGFCAVADNDHIHANRR